VTCSNCGADTTNALCCTVCDTYLARPEAGMRANVAIRLVALLLDLCFLALLFVLAILYFPEPGKDADRYLIWVGWAWLAYSIFSLVLFARGYTPGKYLMGLRIVDKRNGQIPGFGRVFIRELLGKYISGFFLCLGYFWAIFDRDSQAWHDKIAGTIVLREPEVTIRRFFACASVPVMIFILCWAWDHPDAFDRDGAGAAGTVVTSPSSGSVAAMANSATSSNDGTPAPSADLSSLDSDVSPPPAALPTPATEPISTATEQTEGQESTEGQSYHWHLEPNGDQVLKGPAGTCATISIVSTAEPSVRASFDDGTNRMFDEHQMVAARSAAMVYCRSAHPQRNP